MSRRLVLALLLLLALVSAGCSSSVSPSSSSTTSSTVAPGTLTLANGGTATIAVSSLPVNFNPEAPPGENRITNEVMAGVWPHAFVTDDRFQKLAEAGFVSSAEVYGVSPFTVVYQLNPKAVWSDGVPITAADFVYDWHEELKWSALSPQPGLVAGYRAITSITGSDGGDTVTVVFKQPFSEWESLFSTVVPAHVAEQYGWVSAFQGFHPDRVISGGPFLVSSFLPGRQLVLVRNPHYWAGAPHLSKIVFVVESPSMALAGLESGSIAMAELTPGQYIADAQAKAALNGIAVTYDVTLSPTLWQLCFNMSDPVLASGAMRSAIAYSLDVGGVTSNSAGLLDWLEGSTGSRLVPSGEPGAGGSALAATYDPLTALKLYEQAGYRPGADGELRQGGKGPILSLSLDVPRGTSLAAGAAETIAAQLQAIGIRVHVSYVKWSALLGSLLPQGSFQLALAPFLVSTNVVGMAPLYTDAESDPSLPWSLAAPQESPPGAEPGAVSAGVVTRNIFGLTDPLVASDLQEAFTNLNLSVAQTFVQKANDQMWNDLPSIPLFQQPLTLVRRATLVGVRESPTWAGPFLNVQTWGWQVSPVVPLPTIPGISSISPIGPTQVVG